MRCQDVERLILEEGAAGPGERAKLDAHLAQCARCSDWRERWLALRGAVSGLSRPDMPAGLAERVRRAAHAEIAARSAAEAAAARRAAAPAVPGFIWAAFAAITIVTLGFVIPGVLDFVENQKLTLGTALTLILILQNTVTLFFAPVVLRNERHAHGG